MNNDNNKDTILEGIEEMASEDNFQQVLSGALKSFKFSPFRFIAFLFLFSTLFYSASLYSIINLSVIVKIIDRSNTIILALLAIVITGYSIFQAMMSKEAMTIMASYKDKYGQNILVKTHHSTFLIIVSYIFIIIINYTLLTLLDIFSINFFTSSIVYILLTIYCAIVSDFIFEMKSFIYNLYQTFVISTSSQILSLLNKNNSTL